MREDNITHLHARECGLYISLIRIGAAQKRVDSAEDPWRTVARAADHYSVGTREIKYLTRLLRRVDISVREDWNFDGGFDSTNGLVLGGALIKIRARAPMYGKCLNSAALRNPRNAHTIAVLPIPTGADLERYGHAHGANNGLENACDE